MKGQIVFGEEMIASFLIFLAYSLVMYSVAFSENRMQGESLALRAEILSEEIIQNGFDIEKIKLTNARVELGDQAWGAEPGEKSYVLERLATINSTAVKMRVIVWPEG